MRSVAVLTILLNFAKCVGGLRLKSEFEGYMESNDPVIQELSKILALEVSDEEKRNVFLRTFQNYLRTEGAPEDTRLANVRPHLATPTSSVQTSALAAPAPATASPEQDAAV